MDTKRIYPTCCTSLYCGGGGDDCKTCSNGPVLAEFNAWVAKTGAQPADPIWSPLVYVVRSPV
jgi:hypothetical protein